MSEIELTPELHAELLELLARDRRDEAVRRTSEAFGLDPESADQVIAQLEAPGPEEESGTTKAGHPLPSAVAKPGGPPPPSVASAPAPARVPVPDVAPKAKPKAIVTPDDEEVELRWYHHLVAALPLGLVAIGGLVGGALGGLAYGLSITIFKRGFSTAMAMLASLGITAGAVVAYLVIAALFLGGRPAELEEDDYVMLIAAPDLAQEMELDAVRRIQLANWRMKFVRGFPQGMEEVQEYANRYGRDAKALLNAEEDLAFRKLYNKRGLRPVTVVEKDGRAMVEYTLYGEGSEPDRDPSGQALEFRIEVAGTPIYETTIVDEGHAKTGEFVLEKIGSVDDAAALLKHEDLELYFWGVRWCSRNKPGSDDDRKKVAPLIAARLGSSPRLDREALGALKDWGDPSVAGALEAVIESGSEYRSFAFVPLVRWDPMTAARMIAARHEDKDFLEAIGNQLRLLNLKELQPLGRELALVRPHSETLWKTWEGRLGVEPASEPPARSAPKEGLPDRSLSKPDEQLAGALEDFKSAADDDWGRMSHAAAILADPNIQPQLQKVPAADLARGLKAPEPGDRVEVARAVSRWAEKEDAALLDEILSSDLTYAAGWAPAFHALVRLDEALALQAYKRISALPGGRTRLVADLCDRGLSDAGTWWKVAESAEPPLLNDTIFILGHLGNDESPDQLEELWQSRRTTLPSAQTAAVEQAIAVAKLRAPQRLGGRGVRLSTTSPELQELAEKFAVLGDPKATVEELDTALYGIHSDRRKLPADTPAAAFIAVYPRLCEDKANQRRECLELITTYAVEGDAPAVGALLRHNDRDVDWEELLELLEKLDSSQIRPSVVGWLSEGYGLNVIHRAKKYQEPLREHDWLTVLGGLKEARATQVRALLNALTPLASSESKEPLENLMAEPDRFVAEDDWRQVYLAVWDLYLKILGEEYAGSVRGQEGTDDARSFQIRITEAYEAGSKRGVPSFDFVVPYLKEKGQWPEDFPPLRELSKELIPVLRSHPDLSRVRQPTFLTVYGLVAEPDDQADFELFLDLPEISDELWAQSMLGLIRTNPKAAEERVLNITPEETQRVVGFLRDLQDYPSPLVAEGDVLALSKSKNPRVAIAVLNTLALVGGKLSAQKLPALGTYHQDSFSGRDADTFKRQLAYTIEQCSKR